MFFPRAPRDFTFLTRARRRASPGPGPSAVSVTPGLPPARGRHGERRARRSGVRPAALALCRRARREGAGGGLRAGPGASK